MAAINYKRFVIDLHFNAMNMENYSPFLTNGMCVIAPNTGRNENFTKGKKYVIRKVDHRNETSFYLTDDNEQICFCLLKGCAYIHYEDWIILQD